MEKCRFCALQDTKPCYECNECLGGDNHFRPLPEVHKREQEDSK
nr:MAG TPA: hypothetical protein [Caudoviricetes sp.]